MHGTELNELVRRAETIIVPVLPSTIDIKACAHFMAELLEIGKVSRKQARLAVVANRVREYTLIYEELDQYLTKLKVPYLGCLREAQNYVRAYARGMGVLELPGISGMARLEAVGTDRRVARQQEKPALKLHAGVRRAQPIVKDSRECRRQDPRMRARRRVPRACADCRRGAIRRERTMQDSEKRSRLRRG